MKKMENPMKYVWDHMTKQKDGKTIRFVKADIDVLYYKGFVRTTKYSLADWAKAFEPFKKKDTGEYIINEQQFLSLQKYRYVNKSYEPFDPMRVREGSWTDQQLLKFYKRSIAPESIFSEKTFWIFINSLKQGGKTDKDGNLVIDNDIKLAILRAINRYPSPRRRLEKRVQRRIQEERQNLQLSRDQSTFAPGKTTVETKTASFKKLESSHTQSTEPTTPDTSKESIDIKSLRKPRGKVRG